MVASALYFPLGHFIFCTIILVTITIFWAKSSLHRIRTTSKRVQSALRGESETLGRRQAPIAPVLLHRHLWELSLDAQKLQKGLNMPWVNHAPDSNHPWKDVNYPALICASVIV